MESDSDKRKRDKISDDDYRKKKKSKRERTRSRSPYDKDNKNEKRKRRHSKSRSPDVSKKHENASNENPANEVKRDIPERKPKETDMLNTRTGGAYIPPARLRMMQAQITDKSSVAYQRLAWEALKKSIHGHINKINVGNIGIIIKQLLKENIVRGRGLLCRSVIQAQAASPTFTNVYAALVAAVNSRFPNIGELLLKRLVIQFKRGFKRNDKSICISAASFIAHLVNQRVAHEILALELLTLLVETPTDDSVEVAIAFLKECGQKLTEVCCKGVNAIFEMLRNILHEGQLDKRVQYMIEVMFQVWKDGFKDHPAVVEELELVPEEEQFTHLLMLDDATDAQDILNVFKFDDKYEENEQKYKNLSKEILGSDAESGAEEGTGESGSDETDDEKDEDAEQKPVTIIDNTETNLVALRRTIYLTINSSLDFEECAHKLMKMQLKPGQEVELCHMFLDCCAEQRTYEKFYGLLAQRFCNINRIYIGPFEEIFKESYSTAHRLDTNRLRNVSKFFAHLLFTDSISWEVLECVKLNEEDTTSSSRIYIKILFQELAEHLGLKKLNDRLKDPTLQESFSGVFPRDNPKNTRFSINFFTSIGLGGLTDELREHLKQMPKNIPAPVTEIKLDSSDSSSSDSSSTSSSSSDDSSSSESSSSDDGKKKNKKEKKKKASKNSKEPENTDDKEGQQNKERWGHDGFFETYGKDARRIENRPEQNESREEFARPRDIRRRNDERRDNYNSNRDTARDRRPRNEGDDRRYRNESDVRRNRNENDDRRYRNENSDRRYINESDERRRDERRRDERRDEGDNRYERSNDRDRRVNTDRENRDSRDDNHKRKIEHVDKKRDKDREADKSPSNRSYRDNTELQNRRKEHEEKSTRRNKDKHDSSRSRKYRDTRTPELPQSDSNSSSSDESSPRSRRNNKKFEKENTHKKKKSKKNKRNNDSSSSSSSSENEGNDKKPYMKSQTSNDEWDIRRASSLRREITGRYWDN